MNAEPLLVFYNGGDYVVATGVDDAWNVWCAALGEKRQDYEGELEWETVAPDKPIKIRDDDNAVAVKTAAEWAAQEGRCLLCSENF